jgi:hypothetical protein
MFSVVSELAVDSGQKKKKDKIEKKKKHAVVASSILYPLIQATRQNTKTR